MSSHLPLCIKIYMHISLYMYMNIQAPIFLSISQGIFIHDHFLKLLAKVAKEYTFCL